MKGNVRCTAKAPALLILAGVIIVAAGMKAVSSIVVLFFLAVFIAIICTSPLLWLQRKGVPKIPALVLILTAISVAGWLFSALIGPLPNHFLSSLFGHQERLSAHKTDYGKRALLFYQKR